MTVSINNLYQCTDSESPDQSSATMRDQRETLLFDLKNSDGTFYQMSIDDLNLLDSIILGFVTDSTQTVLGVTRVPGGLGRKLPMSHPYRSGFYASSRPVLQGAGVPTPDQTQAAGAALNPLLNPNIPNAIVIYPTYRVSVEFTPRLYNVWANSYISFYGGQWYDDTNNARAFTYVDEWMRFTDVDYHPKDDWISFTLGGQMAFKANPGSDPDNVDSKQYAQMPRIRMPNSTLKITWYQVPYRYVTSPNSYLNKYKGRINQNGWWRWQPGELLYINFNPIRYQQPNPKQVPVFSINPTVANNNPPAGQYPNLAWAQTCDIELEFILTRRVLQPGEAATASALNAVVGGHNLLPWGQDRQFHYAETIGGQTVPFWGSFPTEILFSDPEYVQTGV